MAPQISPDPDMSIADSDFGETALRHSRTLTDLAKEVTESILALSDGSGGKTITAEQEQLVTQRDRLDRQADQAVADHQFAEELKAAATAFRSAAPTAETITYAWDAWQAAKAALREALHGDGPTADAVAAEKRTQQQYFQLQREREQAIATHEEAVQRAMANRRRKRESGVRTPIPDAQHRTPEGGRTQRLGPGNREHKPLIAPDRPQPRTSPSVATGSTPSQAGEISKLLSQVGQPVSLPPQPQQPQVAPQQAPAAMAPAAAGLGGPRAANGRKPIDGEDLDRLTGTPLAGLVTAPPAAPIPAPAQPTPTVTGTSHTGLATTSDVSGRAEPARTAFSPATNLSASHAEQATGKQAAGTGAGTHPAGHGMPYAPVGGMGAGAGGGMPKKESEQIVRYDSEQNYVHGRDVRDESVTGGTILQRELAEQQAQAQAEKKQKND